MKKKTSKIKPVFKRTQKKSKIKPVRKPKEQKRPYIRKSRAIPEREMKSRVSKFLKRDKKKKTTHTSKFDRPAWDSYNDTVDFSNAELDRYDATLDEYPELDALDIIPDLPDDEELWPSR